MNRFIEQHFIWAIILLSFFALCTPELFIWLKSFIPAFLGLIMFGIGIILNYRDFKINSKKVGTLLLVSLIKFFLMSSSAFIIAKVLHLTLYDFIGLVIVGTCPGGTAANVMSYFSKSNTTLTIILTFITTLISPLLMPLLCTRQKDDFVIARERSDRSNLLTYDNFLDCFGRYAPSQ